MIYIGKYNYPINDDSYTCFCLKTIEGKVVYAKWCDYVPEAVQGFINNPEIANKKEPLEKYLEFNEGIFKGCSYDVLYTVESLEGLEKAYPELFI